MKKIEGIVLLFITSMIFGIVFLLYNYTSQKIDEKKDELENKKIVYNKYFQSKESLYRSNEAQKNLERIVKKFALAKNSISKDGKKLRLKVENISLDKQEKLLNTILNEKFMILMCRVENKSVFMEIGL